MITLEKTSEWLDLGTKYSLMDVKWNGKDGMLVKDNETGKYSFDYYYKIPFHKPKDIPEELVEMAQDIWENKPNKYSIRHQKYKSCRPYTRLQCRRLILGGKKDK